MTNEPDDRLSINRGTAWEMKVKVTHCSCHSQVSLSGEKRIYSATASDHCLDGIMSGLWVPPGYFTMTTVLEILVGLL